MSLTAEYKGSVILGLTGNKGPGTIFGTFIRRFHISPALSE